MLLNYFPSVLIIFILYSSTRGIFYFIFLYTSNIFFFSLYVYVDIFPSLLVRLRWYEVMWQTKISRIISTFEWIFMWKWNFSGVRSYASIWLVLIRAADLNFKQLKNIASPKKIIPHMLESKYVSKWLCMPFLCDWLNYMKKHFQNMWLFKMRPRYFAHSLVDFVAFLTRLTHIHAF